jgi:membrane-associated phospholipid phosphatase
MNKNSSGTTVFRNLIKDNKEFFIPFIIFAVVTSILLGIFGNHSLFLSVNRNYSESADYLFLLITNLGDAILAVILIVVLLWISAREALTFLIITLLLAIIVTVLKNYVFPDLNRPAEYYRYSKTLRLVAGYAPPGLCTFPSGHAATIFSVCLYLSFLIKKRYIKIILFVIALIVSYSRIYLSAHFPADVLAGAAIAVPITLLCHIRSRGIKNSWIDWKVSFKPKVTAKEQAT